MISFGRAIGPGGSLQPRIEKKQFKTIDPDLADNQGAVVLSEGGHNSNYDGYQIV